MSSVEIIQSMLAPGIMISACGLLLLGMNSKYSLVVTRIRALDEEKRKLKLLADVNKITKDQEKRLNSISTQIGKFSYRIRMVRNAVIYYSIAVAFFILTCLTIGLHFIIKNIDLTGIVLLLFLVGMLSVFAGIMFACREVLKGYQIALIEIKES
jgi:hypothetical protein